MSPSDEELRAAFSERRGESTADCPDPGAYQDLAELRLPPDEVTRLVEHTITCPACSATLHAAHRVAKAPDTGRGRLWIAAAAVAAAVVAAIVVLRPPTTDPETPLRGSAEALESDLDGAEVRRDAAILRWRPVPGAVAYDIEVTTETLDVVARGHDLAEPRFALPPDAVDELADGSRLLWRVRALAADGSGRWSPTFITVVR